MTNPFACAICGVVKRGHGYRGSPGHHYVIPTDVMIKDRMHRRRLTHLLSRYPGDPQNLLANAPWAVCADDEATNDAPQT